MVGQVKIVGILMIVHGISVILMGGLLTFAGGFLAFAPAPPPAAAGGPPAGFQDVMAVGYVAIGVLIIVTGLLNSVAGIRLIYFRGRVLALVALFANVAALITCYCAPTAIGMMVYGLIVLFQPDVAKAFAAVAGGASPADVVSRYTRRYGDERDDFDDENRSPRYGEERRFRRDDDDRDRE